jgi:hypothetical protein
MPRVTSRLCLAAVLGFAAPAQATDLLPHEGRYVVRLGTSSLAPQVGTARQVLALDCRVWRIERDVGTDIALAAGLRLNSRSQLRGVEPIGGGRFDYQLERVQNERTLSVSGQVVSNRDGAHAAFVLPSRPVRRDLPPGIVLPVAAFARLIDTLKEGATTFSFVLFDPEMTADAVKVEGGVIPADSLHAARADGATLPEGTAWPIEISFTSLRAGGRVLFKATALLHEGGILDRMTIDAGLIAASADLVAFKPLPRPTCPTS